MMNGICGGILVARAGVDTTDFYLATGASWKSVPVKRTLALGVTYWLMRERDDRLRAGAPGKAPAAPRSTA